MQNVDGSSFGPTPLPNIATTKNPFKVLQQFAVPPTAHLFDTTSVLFYNTTQFKYNKYSCAQRGNSLNLAVNLYCNLRPPQKNRFLHWKRYELLIYFI